MGSSIIKLGENRRERGDFCLSSNWRLRPYNNTQERRHLQQRAVTKREEKHTSALSEWEIKGLFIQITQRYRSRYRDALCNQLSSSIALF